MVRNARHLDFVISMTWFRDFRASKISCSGFNLYIDIDVHHGDGVEEAFYFTDR